MLSRIDIRDVKPLLASAVQPLPDRQMVPWELPLGETLAPLGVQDDKTYAEVKVGGEVVATLTNNGYLITSNAMGARLMKLLGAEDSARGPDLAQQRAEKIAKALGGEIVKADTAMSQARWDARPPTVLPHKEIPTARAAESARRHAALGPDTLSILLGLNQS